MNGIVSLLDDVHAELTQKLWGELERHIGLRGVRVTPFPHFSYQIAERYDPEAVEHLLEHLATLSGELTVHASGIGSFTGSAPVLYLPVVRTEALSRFHRVVWQEMSAIAENPSEYYHPDHWIPHITIGFGDLDAARLARAAGLLAGRRLHWEMTIDNLAFIEDTGEAQVIRHKAMLGTPA